MGLRRHAFVAAATALSVLVVSCSGTSQGAPMPAPPSIVKVRMVDYRFIYKAPARAGRAVFSVTNAGGVSHQLTLVPLSEDFPPIDQQLRGQTRRSVDPEAQSPILGPGQSQAFALDLIPGQRYAFVCFLRNQGDSASHALKGMNSEFRAPGAAKR